MLKYALSSYLRLRAEGFRPTTLFYNGGGHLLSGYNQSMCRTTVDSIPLSCTSTTNQILSKTERFVVIEHDKPFDNGHWPFHATNSSSRYGGDVSWNTHQVQDEVKSFLFSGIAADQFDHRSIVPVADVIKD